MTAYRSNLVKTELVGKTCLSCACRGGGNGDCIHWYWYKGYRDSGKILRTVVCWVPEGCLHILVEEVP